MEGLSEADLAPDPFTQFAEWYEWAGVVGVYDPAAMVLSTADTEGRPSARHVLLRGFDDGGFVFYTNYHSRKGRELAVNPNAALTFPWTKFGRQVVITGAASPVSSEESDAYFATRPRGSQLGAWASQQSEPLPDRDSLDRSYAEQEARWDGREVDRPPHWGGYRLVPNAVEFWYGRLNRLHDRLRYVREGRAWRIVRLNP
ncbi:MAG TPA: pyridoxamine 5'-phosphate oxidase [Acidimicrobiales bacterium]|nr:pyridoxamine 5'-phosphate oxidase [Acidimicrobiales bacterium]